MYVHAHSKYCNCRLVQNFHVSLYFFQNLLANKNHIIFNLYTDMHVMEHFGMLKHWIFNRNWVNRLVRLLECLRHASYVDT